MVIIVSTSSSFTVSCLEKGIQKPILLIGHDELALQIAPPENNLGFEFLSVKEDLTCIEQKLSKLSKFNQSTKNQALIHSFITKREKEILLLIAQGKKNREIASELYLSTKTIENHRNKILRKTKVRSMLLLVNELYKLGFLKP